MPERDLALLEEAAQAAAEVATTYIGGALNIRHKAADGSPVTDADMAVDAVLSEILRGARPDYGWLSEESADDAARLEAEHVFIVDPIDGTRSFIEGEDTWAHSLAVARGGEVTAAVIFLPMRGKLYTAAAGHGARLEGAPISVTPGGALETAKVLATRPALAPEHWRGEVPALKRSHRPSIAYRMGLVAEGRYDAMLTLRPSWEWDIAAGALIVAEAGGLATDRAGQPIRFNAPMPRHAGMIAAGPALHEEIIDRLAHET
ncbi:3'(2'),5'-bisphosphate nucleotidase CysQ [Salipiger mucosus]|uniref:Inositol monophosphatase family protein n=1 Tax=Salipiger mucosus DSM 16094 TaxID=1123237 RepID=S9RNP5_9RHOB|nr:3'(2'),5'-bisphosphate nucleotidase CysQ [Salipiger mucosus]EPX79700.1 Inositol monophosphatase family protein [Salipiger mucosus DSM 16094]